MAGASVVPVGFDEADVLIGFAVGALGLGGSEVHDVHLSQIGAINAYVCIFKLFLHTNKTLWGVGSHL